MRVIKVFIDSSAWYSLVQADHDHHEAAKEYFQQILDSRTTLYTNITEITSAISKIKQNCGLNVATEFSKLIDQSILSTNLNVSWLTRRLHRAALKQFFSIKNPQIEIRHCLIFEEIKKKKINIIFSFDNALKSFGIPLMPQA
jgi:predicted nucleic acid-binding protein